MMKVGIDCEKRTIEIFGVSYAWELFEAMAFSPIGTWLRILKRENGLVTAQKPSPELEAEFTARIEGKST